jgi:O-antigen/teichoic acid export membrane protein
MAINTLLSFVLEMGITTTTTREVSAHFDNDSQYITHLVRTASFFYWLSYILIGGAIYLLAPFLVEKWIILKTIDKELAVFTLRVLGITSFLALPKSLYASLFKGLQRMEFNNIIDVLISALRQCGIIVILKQEYSLLEVVYWISFTYIFEIIIYLGTLRKFFSFISFLPGYFHNVAKRNINFATKMMLMTIFGALHRQLDKLIISKLLPIGVLGTYSLAQRAVSVGDLVSNAINAAAYPLFSSLQHEDMRGEMMERYRKLQDFMCVGNALILSAIPFAIVPVLTTIFTKEVAQSLFLPVILLCLHSYLLCITKIPGTVAIAIGKPEIELRTLFYSLIIVAPFSIFAIRRFGLVGAPLGLLMLDIVYYFYAVPRYCKSCLGLPLIEWYVHALKYISLITIAYGTMLYVIIRIQNFDLIFLTVGYCASTFVFVLGSVFVVSNEFKATIVDFAKLRKRKLIGDH